jgi:hypothetical protein
VTGFASVPKKEFVRRAALVLQVVSLPPTPRLGWAAAGTATRGAIGAPDEERR